MKVIILHEYDKKKSGGTHDIKSSNYSNIAMVSRSHEITSAI